MFTLAIKDLKIFIRDRKAIFLTFLLPVALITLFTMAYGGLFGKAVPQPERLLLVDLDSSDLSARLTALSREIAGMTIEPTDTLQGGAAIRKGQRLAMLVIGSGLEDSVRSGGSLPLELWYDQGREIETGMLQEVLMGTLIPEIESIRNKQRMQRFLVERYGMMGEDFVAGLSQDVADFMQEGNGRQAVIRPVQLAGREDVNWGLVQAVAGVAVMMLLFSVAAIGGSILSEKEAGTLKRLLISPVSPEVILSGKLLYAMVIAVVQLLVMFVFGWLAFGLDIWSSPIALLLNILATALACSSFGVFLASISRTRRQVEGLSTIVILIMSAIGGSMIPLFVMPRFMQNLAVISVNYWSIQAFFDIFARNAGFLTVLWKAGILTAISALLMLASFRFFRRQLASMN